MGKTQKKDDFYPKVEEALKLAGYKYFAGDRDIHGKGRSHASKPDYIATRGNTIIIGEIKSPGEPPTSGSWRQIQNSDTEDFKRIRREVARREKKGEVPREVGGHEIIIRGQIPDYVAKLNKTYDLPPGVSGNGIMKGGYTVPSNEAGNVEMALKNYKKAGYEKIDIGNGSVTYIFKKGG